MRFTLLVLSLSLGISFGLAPLHAADDFITATPSPFSDVPRSHWAYKAVEFLRSRGILEGWEDGRMHGKTTFTRYEMAVIVARFMNKLDKSLEGRNLADGQKALLGSL